MGKILIVGATGYIGSKLYKASKNKFITQGTSTKTCNGEYIYLNLEEPENFPYKNVIADGDIVVITAAISAPDVCAKDYENAWAVNVMGTTSFIQKIISRGARVIFLSSDAVYGEQDHDFDECIAPNPAGEYAHMKCEVERTFLSHPLFKSIRLSYVFSREDKFTKYLIGCTERNEEAEVFHPFCRAVIHREDVVDGVIGLIEKWHKATQCHINFGGPITVSRVEFKEIFNKNFTGVLKSRVIEPPPSFFLNRPRIIAMQSPVLKALLGRSPRSLDEAMKIEFPTGLVFDNPYK